jgi:hypothetical protein
MGKAPSHPARWYRSARHGCHSPPSCPSSNSGRAAARDRPQHRHLIGDLPLYLRQVCSLAAGDDDWRKLARSHASPRRLQGRTSTADPSLSRPVRLPPTPQQPPASQPKAYHQPS